MDFFEPSKTMSIGGNYYGLVIVDDLSRFTWTLFIVSKVMLSINAFKKLTLDLLKRIVVFSLLK